MKGICLISIRFFKAFPHLFLYSLLPICKLISTVKSKLAQLKVYNHNINTTDSWYLFIDGLTKILYNTATLPQPGEHLSLFYLYSTFISPGGDPIQYQKHSAQTIKSSNKNKKTLISTDMNIFNSQASFSHLNSKRSC